MKQNFRRYFKVSLEVYLIVHELFEYGRVISSIVRYSLPAIFSCIIIHHCLIAGVHLHVVREFLIVQIVSIGREMRVLIVRHLLES